jgi:phage shock protein E
MKKFIILILMFISTVACGQNAQADKNEVFNPDNVLIDVRSPQEYEAGHLKNARNIPADKIAEEIKNITPDKDKTIVVYCRSGRRSDIAEKALKEMGYKNVINAGRYDDLKTLEDNGN